MMLEVVVMPAGGKKEREGGLILTGGGPAHPTMLRMAKMALTWIKCNVSTAPARR